MDQQCHSCHEKLPSSAYYVDRRSGRLRTVCKACCADKKGLRRVPTTRRLPPIVDAPRRCPDYQQHKPLAEFPRNRSTTDGVGGYCKPCHNTRTRATRSRLYGGGRHCHLQRRYGISAARVDELIAEQGGVCAICLTGKPEHVDHDHRTGEVRGILCFNCNGGLGQMRDRVDVLLAAVDYLGE